MTEAVARGRIAAPGFFADAVMREAWLGSVWEGPSRIQLDPQKEAVADQLDLAMGVTNRETIILERKGGSFETIHEQLVKEQRRRDEDGLVTPQANTGFANADQSALEGARDSSAEKMEAKPPSFQPVINVTTPDVVLNPVINVAAPEIDVTAHISGRGRVEKNFRFDETGRPVGLIEEEVE
jgi:hypothetical protein